MKRFSLLMLVAFLFSWVSASAADYCYPTGTLASSDRRTSALAITMTNSTNALNLSSLQSGYGSQLYFDRSEEKMTIVPGETVTVTPTATGTWMHNYLFVDWDNDGVFTPNLNDQSVPQPGSELVTHNGYRKGDTKPYYLPDGTAVTRTEGSDFGSLSDPISFVVPEGTPAGEYRARYKVSWCSVDPCGNSDDTNNPLSTKGGIVVDFTFVVEGAGDGGDEENELVADVMTFDSLAATTMSDTPFSDVKGKSGNLYAGSSRGYNGLIMFYASTQNSGIMNTTCNGELQSVSVGIDVTQNSSPRTLIIQGSNEPFTDAYQMSIEGAEVGRIEYAPASDYANAVNNIVTKTVELDGKYKYISIWPQSSYIVLNNVTYNWKAGEGGDDNGDDNGNDDEVNLPNKAVYLPAGYRIDIDDRVYFDTASASRQAKSLTYSAWIKQETVNYSWMNTTTHIMGHRAQQYDNSNGSMIMGYKNGATNNYSSTAGASNKFANLIGDGVLPVGNDADWVFLTMSYNADNHTFRYYINGEFQTEVDNLKDWALFNDTNTMLGQTIFFVGRVGDKQYCDEIQLFNRALTDEEVKQSLYDAKSIDGLVALYDFNQTTADGKYPNVAKGAAANTAFPANYASMTTSGSDYNVSNWQIVAPDAASIVDGREMPVVKYTVTINTPENGTLTVEDADGNPYSTGVELANGTTLRIKATANEGYEVENVTANGTALTADADFYYSYTIADENVTIDATFAEVPPVVSDDVNRAVVLPSTGARIEISDEILFDAPADGRKGKSMTYAAWVWYDNLYSYNANARQIMGHRAQEYDNVNGSMLYCYKGNTTHELASVTGAGNKQVSPLGEGVMTAGEWVYLTMSYDADTQMWSFYKNGELVDSYENGQEWALFNDNNGPLHRTIFFVGRNGDKVAVDEIQLFNRALTADEVVKAKYAANDIEGIVALYDFNELTTDGYFANKAKGAAANTAVKASYNKISVGYDWATSVNSNTISVPAEDMVIEGRVMPAPAVPVKNTDNLNVINFGHAAEADNVAATYTMVGESGAEYTGNFSVFVNPSANNETVMVLGSSSPKGFVQTKSNGKRLKKISVHYSSMAASGNYQSMIYLYGKNTAYTGLDEVWGTTDQTGTRIATLYNDQENRVSTFEVPDGANYEYFAARTFASSLYVTDIEIEWDGDGGVVTPAEKYTVSYETPANGTLTVKLADLSIVKSGDEVEKGTELSILATPNEGYELVSVTANGTALEGTQPYSYTVEADVTLAANYALLPVAKHTLTITAPENGTLTVEDEDGNPYTSGTELEKGTDLIIRAEANEGYNVAKVTANGTELTADSDLLYFYTIGDEDVTIAAEFNKAGTVPQYENPAVVLPYTKNGHDVYRIEIPNKVVLENTSAMNSMTMSAWVKFDELKPQLDSPAPIMGHRAQKYDNANGSMYLGINAQGEMSFSAGAGNLDGYTAEDKAINFSPVAGEWAYMTLSYDLENNLWSAYANGELVGSIVNKKNPVAMFGDAFAASGEHSLGNMFFLGNNSLGLTVDEVQFFNRALTAAEVVNAYDNKLDNVEGLVAHYTFDAPADGYTATFANAVEDGADVKAYVHHLTGTTSEWQVPLLTKAEEADIEYAEGRTLAQEYCIPTAKTNNHAARATKALNIKNDRGESLDITGLQSKGMKSDIYFDRTDEAVTLQAGTTVTVTPTADGEWMHNYLFIDWNKDGVFTPNLDEYSVPQAGSELVAHTGYGANGVPFYNSKGETCSGNDKNYGTLSDALPAFVIPADVKPGAYRARYKVSWNSIDPCGTSDDTNNPLDAMGGIVVDFTINVVKDAHEMRTITIATNDAELGKVKFVGVEVEGDSYTTTDNVTVKATATDADAYFVNWTDGDNNVVAETEEFEYKGDAEITLTANFRQHYAVTFDAAEGIRVATAAGAITSGSMFDRGTELTVTVNAPAGKQLAALTVNDTDVTADMEGNTYTFELASTTTIAATYEDLKATLSISVEGYGKVVVETAEGVTYEDGDEIPYGTEFTISFIPDAGEDLKAAIIDDYDWMENKADMTDLGNGAYAVDYDATEATIAVSATFSTKRDALESIEAAINSGAEYFNLQGVRVENQNIVPGIYIRRAEGKVNKVLVK